MIAIILTIKENMEPMPRSCNISKCSCRYQFFSFFLLSGVSFHFFFLIFSFALFLLLRSYLEWSVTLLWKGIFKRSSIWMVFFFINKNHRFRKRNVSNIVHIILWIIITLRHRCIIFSAVHHLTATGNDQRNSSDANWFSTKIYSTGFELADVPSSQKSQHQLNPFCTISFIHPENIFWMDSLCGNERCAVAVPFGPVLHPHQLVTSIPDIVAGIQQR